MSKTPMPTIEIRRRPVCLGFHRTPWMTVWFWDWEDLDA